MFPASFLVMMATESMDSNPCTTKLLRNPPWSLSDNLEFLSLKGEGVVRQPPCPPFQRRARQLLAHGLQWERTSQKGEKNHTMKSPDFNMKSALADFIKIHIG
jgi:hypothetical protein